MRTVSLLRAAVSLGAILALAAVAPTFALANSQSYTAAGEHAFVVPPGVSSVQVLLVGGNGGAGSGAQPGGLPATVNATLAVTSGETLYAEVAGNGETATGTEEIAAGGYGGGAAGGGRGFLTTVASGGGGGGASDVRTCSESSSQCSSLASRLVVASGGGGAGGEGPGSGSPDAPGGAGGGYGDAAGFAGTPDANADPPGGGGSRASAGAGGALGAGPNEIPSLETGALGIGGDGGESSNGGGGGGGGGGIYGGGGGGAGDYSTNAAGGGGGGAGWPGVPVGATGVSGYGLVLTLTGAEPQVTFSWVAPTPAVITGAATAITATAATLNGTVNPYGSAITSCQFTVSPGVTTLPCTPLAAGATPEPVSAQLSGLMPATTYTVTLSANSSAGTDNGPTVTFTTAASAPNTAASPTTVITPSPRISHLTVIRRVQRSRASGGRVHPAVSLSLSLSQNATVTFTFERQFNGRRAQGGRCVATKRRPPRASRCRGYAPVAGSLTVVGTSGANSIRFAGVLNHGRRLALGAYRLIAVATNAAGKSSLPTLAKFTLIK